MRYQLLVYYGGGHVDVAFAPVVTWSSLLRQVRAYRKMTQNGLVPRTSVARAVQVEVRSEVGAAA